VVGADERMKRALLLLALVGCKQFDDYQSRGRRTEAELNLQKIRKALQVHVIEAARPSFPLLTLGPTPEIPCCMQEKVKCAVDPAQWTAWAPLDFSMTEPFRFQYTYSSTDGQTFVATAIGDLDCDTNNVVYRLTGKIENGAAVTSLEVPTNTD
jgi:hypothetical protein